MPGPELQTVVMASRNRGKVRELASLLASLPWSLQSLDDVPGGTEISWDESGSTYRENAAIKAEAVCRGTGLPALADDSGIELEALGGFPGVRSARWLGDDATEAELRTALCARVADLAEDARGARFVCVLALAVPSSRGRCRVSFARGSVAGTLLPVPRGVGGFGYDPIFIPAGETVTMAEMPRAQKDRLSHRGRAARALIRIVSQPPGVTPVPLPDH
ncbi:MAG: non-canonical purine NTP pyrophosphatase [Candidatus Dormibacteria bacterium]